MPGPSRDDSRFPRTVCRLLFFFGRLFKRHGRAVVAGLCVVIHVLVYFHCNASILLTFCQIWSTFHDPQQSFVHQIPHPVRLTMALTFPYVAFMGFVLATVVYGAKHPTSINDSNGLYCTVVSGSLYAPHICTTGR
jgi:hypothetical protein